MKKPKSKNNNNAAWYTLALARISLGFIFLWSFFDKLFGLGFTTCRDAKTDIVTTMCEKAWINGGSPTDGFLKFAAKGPFADLYGSLAGNQLIATLFMAGLLLVGLALVLGIGIKVAVVSGSLLMFMMWTAVLPPEHHPVLDDHIVYIFTLLTIMFANSNQKWGLGSWWSRQKLVKNYPVLQ